MPDRPAAVFRRLVEEVLNANNLDAIDDLVTPDYIDHTGGGNGPAGYRETIEFVRQMFPDLHMRIDDMVEQGDKVAARFTVTAAHRGEFMGIPATSKNVSWQGIGIVRVVNGKMAERWNVSDMMGLLNRIRD